MANLWQRLLWTFIILSFIDLTKQNTRQKRQISVQQPKIVTQNGHLIFQTGTNHNITFKSASGGFINVDGENLNSLAQTVKSNKEAIDEMKTTPTSVPSNIDTRLTNLEQRVNNLQPTGEVLTQLNTITQRLTAVEGSVSSDITNRISQVENSVSALSSLPSNVNNISTRLATLEASVTGRRGQRRFPSNRQFRSVRNQVRRLQTIVNRLSSLLTVDECSSNPCRNGGECVDRYNGYTCNCPAAWQGSNCDEDVNECAEYAGTDLGCQNNAVCVNSPGTFSCQCTSGWYGLRCSQIHNSCNSASNVELCGHGTCINSAGGQNPYTCICDVGWTTSDSSPACNVDVNECEQSRSPCSVDPPVQCVNVPGTFYCGVCPSGFSGNGFQCVDINECLVNNGGCSLSPRVNCVNTPGSRTCGPCPQGYVGDGTACTFVGVCGTNNGGCHYLADCREGPGYQGRECICPPGYVGNGVGNVGCVAQGPSTGACASNPCRNGAACQSNGNSYECMCRPGYTDQQCTTNIDECASSPCQNGGTCVDQVNGYQCQCTNSATGPNCENEQEVCGGRLTGETGSFSYPSAVGTNYPHGVSCAWTITTSPGKIVQATFTRFNVEYHAQCRFDFMQVNDGYTAASYALGRYCGTTLPNNGYPINSTAHYMYFWFFSDVSVNDDGFAVSWTSADAVCGGILSGALHGSINSPGYPGNYPHDRTCVWQVNVPPGNNILFTFATIAIEEHSNCSYDYLEIRDGPLDTSPLMQRFCSRISPRPLTTTGPDAYVKFHSDSNMNDRGFHITYVASPAPIGCGGIYTQDSGVITSPNYPSYYDHNGRCSWLITVGGSDIVRLTFTNFALEGGSCFYDFVEIRDGNTENAPLLGRLCGTSLPSAITSTGNSMYITFSTDGSVTNTGFRAEWTAACGGIRTGATGTIQSPGYPNAYPANKECIYTITRPNGQGITLTFSAFSVEGSSGNSCDFDFVEVRDGGSANSPLLGSFCGEVIPDPVMTTQRMMWIKFKTDGSVHNTGFQATYTSAQIPCGGLLTSSNGTLRSPGHPTNYPHGVNCTWAIRVSPGFLIRLTFNTFRLEGSGSTCYYDYVNIYDNATINEGSRIGHYCGSAIPPVITSSDNVMVINFKTDGSVAYTGFTADYISLNASTVCGRTLTSPNGIITSPNYPSYYPHGRECIWVIHVQTGKQIMLNVTDFSLESHPNCNFDYLEIRNGGNEESPLIGKYCGNDMADRIMVSHGNRMYVKFKSDGSAAAQGFRIVYDATLSGCGGDLTAATGSFVSPNYPNPVGSYSECYFTITVSQGSLINFTFSVLDIPNSSRECLYNNYILVKDSSSTGTTLGRFCGTSIPEPLISTSNKLWIQFRSGYGGTGTGFYVTYSSICNNRLSSHSGVIESPNFPNSYDHDSNCTWILDVASGNTVNVSFSHFELEEFGYSNDQCVYDYLQINDGEDLSAPVLGKFCGSTLPPAIASSTNNLRIQFVADESVNANGFRLEYITNGCGGYLTAVTGEITSPNYPNNYPVNRICEWNINLPTGYSVELNLTDVDIESHTTCRFDGIDVYAGMDDSSPQIATHCTSRPGVLSSTGNQMFIRFRSDFSLTGRGFRGVYRGVPGGCGGNFSMMSGLITSKNYPENYPHSTECAWLLTVNPQSTIRLTFTNFSLEGHPTNCYFDYVNVYDGPTTNNTRLLHHCGYGLPTPPVVRSSGNQMFIRMRTDGSVSSLGFRAVYVSDCGGTLNAENDGVLTSPNYPSNYDNMHNCSWLIVASHSDDRVTLMFTAMDIEESLSGTCAHDYVAVYGGMDANSPLLGRYCGRTIPQPLTSQGSMMYVQFVTDMNVQKTGFRAVYTKSSSSCGGDISASSGYFASPGYPNNYPNNVECVWNFQVSPGNRLALSFSVFNIGHHDTCNVDYLEIREGDVNGRLIGRYCGNQIPTNITALRGGAWVKFRSDPLSTGAGFLGEFNPVYGGYLSGSSGQLASPMYPLHYPNNADYTWIISVDQGMRIRVSFVAIEIEYWNSCIYDYVKFLDGGTADSVELGRYCGINIPEPFITTTNQMRVEFHTDSNSVGSGFLINWEATNREMPTLPPSTTPIPECGGLLAAVPYLKTSFVNPGYPYGYANNLECTWRIITLPGYIVWFNISYIDIEAHSACYFDTLSVYDGAQVSGSPRIGQFCGRVGNAAPLLSSTANMVVQFKTDYSINGTGFIVYLQAVCGGRMTTPTGLIRSPRFPNNYMNNNNCSWSIVVSNGKTVRLQFNTTFNIVGTRGSCNSDYIQLLNGDSRGPPIGNGTAGKYCGNTAPPVMESSGNVVYVLFATDGTGSASGFALQYTEVSITCGGHLELSDQVTSGYFSTPNYPRNYPHNVECIWIIISPATTEIRIDFVGNFSIEQHTSCRYDFVEIRDGGTMISPQLAKYCGNTLPSSVKSTGNVMYVRFFTEDTVARTGFRAQYKIATCGGRYAGSSGTIMSPGYPTPYPPNIDCEWTIQAPTGHYISMSFESFNLQHVWNNNCSSIGEYLEIRDVNTTGPVLLFRCGYARLSAIDTSDSFAYLRFKSGSNTNRYNTGFKLNFQASVEVCGGDLTTPSGAFTSPNFPGQYAHNRICEWRITVQPGRRVTLTFDSFNLEAHGRCAYDYVAVYNGILSDSSFIARLCGDVTPNTIESSGNTMKILFRTDGSISNGGFSASYTSLNEQKCGGILTSSVGMISSPGNTTYNNSLECIWTISNTSLTSTSIYIQFHLLALEYHAHCSYDFLEFREGTTGNGQLIDRYCGNTTIPQPIVSPFTNLWIRFRTDSSIVDRGFKLRYAFTDCGGILTSPYGIITSPNFPNLYNHSDACAWLLRAPEGFRINIRFTDFNLEPHPNCVYDNVQIINGGGYDSPVAGKYCSNSTPPVFRSQSNEARVIFSSDFSVNRQGFRLIYFFEAGGCGGTFHSDNGHIQSPNHPRSYPHNTECLWDINVTPGYHVVLRFIPPFDLQGGDCQTDYVEVSDSLSNNSLVPVGRWCSNLTPPQQNSTGSRLVVKFRSDAVTNGNGFAANWTVGCGARFTSDEGTFVSPAYPEPYANNLLCNYTISVDSQKHIVLTFINDYEIEGPASCPYDYVIVYAGNDTTGRRLGKFCGTTKPQPLTAVSNMFIQFVTDSSITKRGFQIKYMASECGGNFTEPSGRIRTPQQPASYHHNANCTWLITVEPNRIVGLKFNEFEVEPHPTCRWDYVDVRDGNTLQSPLLGRYCGNTVPGLIRTTGNAMTINFISDISIAKAGFKAAYYTTLGVNQGCGGYLNQTSGRFGSVDIDGDGKYENDLDCMWTIIVNENNIVKLNISNITLESYSCRYDYIKIYDGMSAEDPLIGTFCGTNAPGEIKSTSNVLYVVFHTDFTITKEGFNATYVQEEALCGGSYTASNDLQTITSPGYPSPSIQPLRCRWTIDAPEEGQTVRINFTDINLITEPTCNSEYIELRDRPLGTLGRSVHYCGTTPPNVFDSIGRTMQVNYVVTGTSGSQGFSLQYEIATCNKTFSGYSGQVYSPGWPVVYPVNTYCEMSITGPAGTFLALYFNAFTIESHRNCAFDYLEIRNGSSSTSPVIIQLCGYTIPNPVFATGNSLFLIFQTDRSIQRRGFDITYTATTSGSMGCGGNITGINGSLTSPGYPNNYTENHNCEWLISVPARRVVQVTFSNINIIGTENCDTDYVEIYNGATALSPSFGRFCGNDPPAPLTAAENKVLVKFVSDGLGSAIGFRIVFTS